MLKEGGAWSAGYMLERGAVKSDSLGAWSEDAKIGRSVERWRPPNEPQKQMSDEILKLEITETDSIMVCT